MDEAEATTSVPHQRVGCGICGRGKRITPRGTASRAHLAATETDQPLAVAAG